MRANSNKIAHEGKLILVQFCRFSLYLLSNFTEKRDVFRLQNPRETIQANISAVNDVNLKKVYIYLAACEYYCCRCFY